MIFSRVELVARRRLVNAFIQADHVDVDFTRVGPKVKSPAGGYTRGSDTVLDTQRVAIVPSKRRYDHGLINSEAGSIPETEYLLLGSHTLNVEENDHFTWMGQSYFVKAIHPVRRNSTGNEVESILCAIDFRGPDNG